MPPAPKKAEKKVKLTREDMLAKIRAVESVMVHHPDDGYSIVSTEADLPSAAELEVEEGKAQEAADERVAATKAPAPATATANAAGAKATAAGNPAPPAAKS